jgi:hypothetical protein
MIEAVELLGAVAVLAAFAASQAQVLGTQTLTYLTLNFAGSFVLAAIALSQNQWGFLLLEGAWALVSAWALSRRFHAASRRPRGKTASMDDIAD